MDGTDQAVHESLKAAIAATARPAASLPGELLLDKAIVAGAKALALDHAEVCNVNYDDLWKLESESFMVQARLALGAARAALSAHQPEAKHEG